MNWRHRARSFLLPAILLLAYALRVFRLDYQELRGDETFGYLFSQNAWLEIVRQTIAFKEPHPVASYFVQKAWLMLAGHGEFALRFTGVWFSAPAVALLYRLAPAGWACRRPWPWWQRPCWQSAPMRSGTARTPACTLCCWR